MADGIIKLNKWSEGMSVDDYGGGGFLYGERINVFNKPECFKIAKSPGVDIINNRGVTGYLRRAASVSSFFGRHAFLSGDGYIEGVIGYSSFSNTSPGTNGTNDSGAFYERDNAQYIGGVRDNLFMVDSQGELTRFRPTGLFVTSSGLFSNNLITNPGLTSNTGWTVGAGRTTGSTGAVHTPGNTAALSQSITPTNNTKHIRVGVKIIGATAGAINLTWRGQVVDRFNIDKDYNGVVVVNIIRPGANAPTGSGAGTFSIEPTSNFDGTVTWIDRRQLDSNFYPNELTLDGGVPNCHLDSGGLLYIGTTGFVNVITTASNTGWIKESSLALPATHKVIGITKIGDTINVYARDESYNTPVTIQYFWNGIDTFPAESLRWEGLWVKSVASGGNQDYVVAYDGYRNHMYVCSGRQKKLMYSSTYESRFAGFGGINRKNGRLEENKFYFHGNSQGIATHQEFVAITGYQEIYLYGNINAGRKKGIALQVRPEMADQQSMNFGFDTGPFVIAYGNGFGFPLSDSQFNYLGNSNLVDYGQGAAPSGFLITNPILWDKHSSLKMLKKIKIGIKFPRDGKVNLYAKIDDNYFMTVYVTNVTTRPDKGDVYYLGTSTNNNGELEVISSTGTGTSGFISGRLVNGRQRNIYTASSIGLQKKSGAGQTTFTNIFNWDNFIKIKEINSPGTGMMSELVFNKDMLDVELPHWHKLQLKVELERGAVTTDSPEVYDITLLAGVVENDGI